MIKEELQKRDLPDLFLRQDGTRVPDCRTWEEEQRPLWRKRLLENEYGLLPPAMDSAVTVTVDPTSFGGKVVWEVLRFTFARGAKSHTVPVQLLYPRGARQAPLFLHISFSPWDLSCGHVPLEEILDNGFGLMAFPYDAVTQDNGDFSDGLAGLFSEGERGADSFGKLALWAYMAMHLRSYLETREEIDQQRVAVVGHGRFGRAALLAAALDERFAAAFVAGAGCAGVALSRGASAGAETPATLYEKAPHWFCPRYESYIRDPASMPFDQHALLALIAPRLLCVGTAAEDDVIADAPSQFLSCAAASPAWTLYGSQGLIAPSRLPTSGDEFTGGKLGFYMRPGTPYFSRVDWNVYMRTMQKHFS